MYYYLMISIVILFMMNFFQVLYVDNDFVIIVKIYLDFLNIVKKDDWNYVKKGIFKYFYLIFKR